MRVWDQKTEIYDFDQKWTKIRFSSYLRPFHSKNPNFPKNLFNDYVRSILIDDHSSNHFDDHWWEFLIFGCLHLQKTDFGILAQNWSKTRFSSYLRPFFSKPPNFSKNLFNDYVTWIVIDDHSLNRFLGHWEAFLIFIIQILQNDIVNRNLLIYCYINIPSLSPAPFALGV